jgi:hypothetical protein
MKVCNRYATFAGMTIVERRISQLTTDNRVPQKPKATTSTTRMSNQKHPVRRCQIEKRPAASCCGVHRGVGGRASTCYVLLQDLGHRTYRLSVRIIACLSDALPRIARALLLSPDGSVMCVCVIDGVRRRAWRASPAPQPRVRHNIWFSFSFFFYYS